MINLIHYIISLTVLIGLTACGGPDLKKNTTRTYIAKIEPLHKTLYFSGTIQPLQESALTSPVDAIVEKLHCRFGQHVKKGDPVLTLNSQELQKQYNDTLTDYLKAKDSYTVAKAKFVGTEELWQAGLLSKNNYLSEKSSLDMTRITLMQATRKLSEMLEKTNEGNKQDLSELTIAQFEKVRQVLIRKHNLIQLAALSEGVLLYPPKSGEEKDRKLEVGSVIKAGQVIALVGNLQGISVEIAIPEIDIVKVYPGMKASITGVALGEQSLQGELVAVTTQASTGNGGLPFFAGVVEVQGLTPAQQSWIRVGMSATVALSVDEDKQLLIPITAVKQEKGKSIVRIQKTAESTEKRVISTGQSLTNKVVVTAGLKVGEKVIYE